MIKNGMNEKLEAMNGGKKNGIHYKIKSCLHWLFYRWVDEKNEIHFMKISIRETMS
jgi:hypothetical protein